MYRNQFRSDRFNDNTNAARRPGRGSGSSTHHWVVSGARGSAAPAARPRSPPYRSGRPGSVQQQYRPRSPAGALTQGNAISHTPAASAAGGGGHTEPVSKVSFGSLDNVKPSNVPAQSDVLSSASAEGTWAANSSKGYSSTAFTLQFGTFSPGTIDKQCTACTSSAPSDLNPKQHEKDHHGLSDKTNIVSSSPDQEQRKHEATDGMVIGGRTDLTDKYENVPVSELHETRVLNSLAPPSKVGMDSCKVLARTLSSRTHQQSQNQEERKDMVSASRLDTVYKYPATKPKISVQIPASNTPNMAPPPFMHPIHGRPLPMAFQQKQTQVPVEFRGPGLQMQSIGSVASSLPMKMALPLSNAPHMQPLFAHGAQPRALHQQTFIQQGQGFGCAPPVNCHLPQFGNMRIAQELSQQQPRSADENKRTIKITHPETHEELMLDRRGHSFIGVPASGQMPLHSTNQLHQPVQTYPPLQKMYYPRPGTYNSAPLYLPNTNSAPLAAKQLSSKMQPPMHSFGSTNSNLPITSIKPPMPNPWLDASSTPLSNLHLASEVSSFKGSLPSSLSAPVQIEPKSPIALPTEKNEVSSETSIRICGAETHTSRYSSESYMSNSEGNPKVPAASSDAGYNSIYQTVPTQQARGVEASADHITRNAGPQNISTSNLPLASTSRCTEMEESPVVPTTSSSHAKCDSSHTKASNRTDSSILTATSFVSTTDGASPPDRNSKHDSSSILGKPPLIYTQEMLSPKSAGSSTFTECLKTERVNTFPCLEKNSEVSGSVSLENQDFMIEGHVVNDKVMCRSKSKADVSAACGLEDDTDVSESVRIQARHESDGPHPTISIDDLETSSENKRPPSDAQNTDCAVDSARHVKNEAIVSHSMISGKKIEQESIDSDISNSSSTASASVVETKSSALESTKAKSTCGRRKRQKETLPKASGQRYSDLDYAFSSLNETEIFNTSNEVHSSYQTNVKSCTLDAQTEISTGGDDSPNRTDLIDWEDATENSTENLEIFGCIYSNSVPEVNKDKDDLDHKKYSRDFLLTFAQSCIHLPAGFKIGSDISQTVLNVHAGTPFIANSELNPIHGRIRDQGSRGYRHMAGKFISASGCDSVNQPALSSWDAIQRFGHGVTRSPKQNHPFNQYSGEMLSRAMKEVVSQRSMLHGTVDERWQHRTNVHGISSPSTPLMHKAEKKYEIGKVSDEEESKQRQLKAILNKLTPQNFEKLFAQVKGLNIDNVVTLTGVISQIFDKALMEPTFCEMYASFCFRLAGDLPNFVKDDEKITFKRLLLNKCQEEFERGEREQAEADKSEEEGATKQSEGEREEKRIRARRRMLGNIRLIGELYKKKMLTERIMHECINKLLGEYQNPDEEDLEALCKLMSTIGEMIDHPRAKVHMDFYFDIMQKLSQNCKLSSRMRFMLVDVIDLRRNKWRHRRKVEGPKKIEEVRRDAVKQKLGQSTRFGSPSYNSSVTRISSGTRAGPPSDNNMSESSALAPRGSSQVRTYGSQNVNLDARCQRSNKALPVPLHQRRADKSIRLGPQGHLGREMSLCGKPPVSNDILPEVPLNVHHGQTSLNSTEGSVTRAARNRTNFKAGADTPINQSWGATDQGSPALSTASQAHTSSMISKGVCAEAQTFPDDVLQEKSILTIKEFYRQAFIAKDEEEVALCMKELNAPSFYPSLVSLWINDSFERKDLERELLAKLLVHLCKSEEKLLNQKQLLQGFQHVLSTLEDAVTDAPKATEFLGRIFAKFILEDVISLTEIGELLQDRNGKAELTGHHPLDDSLASEVLRSMLESIRVERGDSAVDEIREKNSMQYFRCPGVCF
ncbi:hypothetical protein EJB05_38514 [Eragrostis curvula]|uniref:Eukaryotic translation initiation factor 4G n=1 Tax=Eragrostis curvula TaxID=38414 RepID=A0A5J9TUH3_9POAL|nr:hypothetical protein EJB05_38514 [Eragrostis curvula]